MFYKLRNFDLYFTGRFRSYVQAGMRLLSGLCAIPSALCKSNGVRAYWGFRNFGDLLTPMFLRELGFTPINCPHPAMSKIMLVGSILDPLSDNYRGIIFGAGLLRPDRLKHLQDSNVVAVRGRLSKKNLGIDSKVLYGDPGLLLPYFIRERPSNEFVLGIVPHYEDKADRRVADWVERFGADVCVVDVYSSPVDVFKKICQCRMIMSSSLHGIVVADSLGIPSLWMKLCERDEFKYHDYYSAFDEEVMPYYPSGSESLCALEGKMRHPSILVKDVQAQLFEAFMDLKRLL